MTHRITRLLVTAVVLGGASAQAATDLEKLLSQAAKYGVVTEDGVPPSPAVSRKGLCLCSAAGFPGQVGTLAIAVTSYGFPLRSNVRAHCWVGSYDAVTGAPNGDVDCYPFDLLTK